ncbi:uncharacterized protein [Paramisgurnus dabryanus]|uniref:uncharacterized protein n=1 Tax=Paramisgurnus dabryanus TaxID=90735 RepID=UPI003CCFA56F
MHKCSQNHNFLCYCHYFYSCLKCSARPEPVPTAAPLPVPPTAGPLPVAPEAGRRSSAGRARSSGGPAPQPDTQLPVPPPQPVVPLAGPLPVSGGPAPLPFLLSICKLFKNVFKFQTVFLICTNVPKIIIFSVTAIIFILAFILAPLPVPPAPQQVPPWTANQQVLTWPAPLPVPPWAGPATSLLCTSVAQPPSPQVQPAAARASLKRRAAAMSQPHTFDEGEVAAKKARLQKKKKRGRRRRAAKSKAQPSSPQVQAAPACAPHKRHADAMSQEIQTRKRARTTPPAQPSSPQVQPAPGPSSVLSEQKRIKRQKRRQRQRRNRAIK